MILKQLLKRFRSESKVNQLARDVAERCRHDVWDRVWRRVATMEAAEARGYVRARAAMVVSREVEWVAVQSTNLSETRRERLFDQALVCVTQLILAEARALQVAPARHAA